MLICVQLNPAIDNILEVPDFNIGSTFRVEKTTRIPLGKAISVGLSAKTINETPLVISLIGSKEEEFYAHFLSEKGIRFQLIPTNGETRENLTIIDPVHQTTTHLRERGFTPSPSAIASLKAILNECVTRDSIVLFAGSLPPGVPSLTFYDLITHLPPCRACGLDTSGVALREGLQARPQLIKPNLEELHDIFPDAPTRVVNIKTLLPFIPRFREKGVIYGAITLGAQGSLVWDASSAVSASVTLSNVVDTVGCGDAFFAGMAVGVMHNWSLEQTARVATAAAGANTLTVGAGIFKKMDFQELKEIVNIETF